MRGHHRRWAITFWAVAVSVTAVGLVLVVTRPGTHPGWVRAGTTDEIIERGVSFVPEIPAYVVARRGGTIALYARDPHLREPVRFCSSSGWFEDRIHGSMFDGAGRYVLGPAPRGLDRFDVHIVGDEVWIDPTNLYLGPPRGVAGTASRPSGPFCRSGS